MSKKPRRAPPACRHYIPYTSADLTKGRKYETDTGPIWVRVMGDDVRFEFEFSKCPVCGQWPDKRVSIVNLCSTMAAYWQVMSELCWADHKPHARAAGMHIAECLRDAAGIDREPAPHA